MKWFPNSHRRADADARRRHVRPELELLECRIVPQGSGTPNFWGGVAYANQELASVGSNPQSRVAEDWVLIQTAMQNTAAGYSTLVEAWNYQAWSLAVFYPSGSLPLITPACKLLTKCAGQSAANKAIGGVNLCEAYMPG
jgi:hypothetical protein